MATNDKCDLVSKKCTACTKATPPLSDERVDELHRQIPNWRKMTEVAELTKDKVWLERHFTLRNFREAMTFLNNVAAIAEKEGHHPDFTLYNYKYVSIRLTTHAIGKQLSENDFIVAAKIDAIYDS